MNSFEIIRTVRLTEKGTRQGEKYNQYTLMADPRANKTQIRTAVQDFSLQSEAAGCWQSQERCASVPVASACLQPGQCLPFHGLDAVLITAASRSTLSASSQTPVLASTEAACPA